MDKRKDLMNYEFESESEREEFEKFCFTLDKMRHELLWGIENYDDSPLTEECRELRERFPYMVYYIKFDGSIYNRRGLYLAPATGKYLYPKEGRVLDESTSEFLMKKGVFVLRTPTQYIVLRPDGKYYIYNPKDVKPIRLLSDTIKAVNKSKNLTKVLKKLNEKGKKEN
ncbi:MAG: hypothetical protein ACP5F0_07135 [Sulfurihydrogenibium sp.]